MNKFVMNEWGKNTLCQIYLITDGGCGRGSSSLMTLVSDLTERKKQSNFPLPFAFPSKLHIVSLCEADDPEFLRSYLLYQKLLNLTNQEGSVLRPEGQLTFKSIAQLFHKLVDENYRPFKVTLKCGNIESPISLNPSPMAITRNETEQLQISDVIEICGFLPIVDIGSPIVFSRHLVVQLSARKDQAQSTAADSKTNQKPLTISSTVEEETENEGNIASFCVLLHGSLKVENFAALVCFAPDWFGFIYPFADTKKKSNLMLTVLQPHASPIPWLGNLNNIGFLSNYEKNSAEIVPLPLKAIEKKSYSQNFVTWIKPQSLQSDIQKVLRHARKIPEKTQQFYKELNKLRRAAIVYGFYEVIASLVFIFEAEKATMLSTNGTNPDTIFQMTHIISELKKKQVFDLKHNLTPLQRTA